MFVCFDNGQGTFFVPQATFLSRLASWANLTVGGLIFWSITGCHIMTLWLTIGLSCPPMSIPCRVLEHQQLLKNTQERSLHFKIACILKYSPSCCCCVKPEKKITLKCRLLSIASHTGGGGTGEWEWEKITSACLWASPLVSNPDVASWKEKHGKICKPSRLAPFLLGYQG